MEEENNLLNLINDTEYLLGDILLSGFHSIQMSSIEKLNTIKSIYSQYGMVTGERLIDNLYNELIKRRNSFEYNISKISDSFCQLEFYLKNAQSKLN